MLAADSRPKAPSLNRKSVTFLAVVAFILGACTAVGPGAGPTSQPSKACGGFHVVIENATGARLLVSFNGDLVTEVKAGATAGIAQYGSYRVPEMPWAVEVVRSIDAVVVFSGSFRADGTDGVRVHIESEPVAGASTSPFVC
jgi:hypothetical protein